MLSVRPRIDGLSGPHALRPGDGVHLLHSIGDTLAVMTTHTETAPATASTPAMPAVSLPPRRW